MTSRPDDIRAWLRAQQREQRDADVRAGRKTPRTMREMGLFTDALAEPFEVRQRREAEERAQCRADKRVRRRGGARG